MLRATKCVVLDIDGVLIRGGNLIKGADKAVANLKKHGIPYVFVTNGGGTLESKKAQDLSSKLGLPVSPDTVVVSHTPMQNLIDKHGEQNVLIIGKDHCVTIAQSYGFKHACGIPDIHRENLSICPVKSFEEFNHPPTMRAPIIDTFSSDKLIDNIGAIMVFHDPVDWGLEMQALCDVLYHNNPKISGNRKHIPFYVSNADIVYTSEHPHPRFTQGAFAEAFRHLYESYTGEKLETIFYGKPYPAQYSYAAQILATEAKRLSLPQPTRYFGVGDNPKSDIRGANQAGKQWTSVLVRTGVFNSDQSNDSLDPADCVCDDISAAVDWIISQPDNDEI